MYDITSFLDTFTECYFREIVLFYPYYELLLQAIDFIYNKHKQRKQTKNILLFKKLKKEFYKFIKKVAFSHRYLNILVVIVL
jgi:hypothetical protein